jgi:L-threonylcarbamoyladenylate synthase
MEVEILKKGGVGVIPTDTLYGLVASAFNRGAVDKVYKLKNRQSDKPCIILIGHIDELQRFCIKISTQLINKLSNYWPGPVSIILPCHEQRLLYLHRGTRSLAFRLPAKKSLKALLARSGPLVAPSANPENQPPAQNIKQAKAYFGEQADFYLNGRIGKKASKLIKFVGNDVEIIRA